MFNAIISMYLSAIMIIMSAIGVGGSGTYSYETIRNVSYGSSSEETMDIYIPENAYEQENNGVILFIHGGWWVTGEKEGLVASCKDYAKKGYITVSMNYDTPSYSDLLTFVSMSVFNETDDVNSCIAYLKTYFEEKNISVSHLALNGFSSGAHVAMMYAYRDYAKSAIPIDFVVDRSGPSDMDPGLWKDYYGKDFSCYMVYLLSNKMFTWTMYENGNSYAKAAIDLVSPVSYVTASTVPTIMCYGEKDSIVPPACGPSLKNAFDEAGATYTYIDYPDSGHLLLADLDSNDQYEYAFDSYLNTYFGY